MTTVAGEDYLNLYGRDVTEERIANQKVIEARNFNEAILANLSNGVITLDAGQRITKTNEAARRILQLGDADLVGKTADEVFTGENAWII